LFGDRDISYSYYPVVEFTSSRGKVVQFTSKLGRNPPAFKEGQVVKVLYDPQNVNSAKIAASGEIWLAPTIVAILGTAFSIGSIFVFLKRT